MNDIKERVKEKNPKIRNPATKLPKELARSVVLKDKEKLIETYEKNSNPSETTIQYGSEKIEALQYRGAKCAGKTTYQGGKKLTGLAYRNIKERKNRQGKTKTTEDILKKEVENGRALVKEKAKKTAFIKNNGKKEIKAPTFAKEKIKTQAFIQKEHIGSSAQTMQKARTIQIAKKTGKTFAEGAGTAIQTTGRRAKFSLQAITKTIQKAMATLGEMGKWMVIGGGAILVVFILIVGIIAGVVFYGEAESSEALSAEVLSYTSTIQKYASKYGISEYVSAIQAIMMQESGGKGTDPMQCSESPYNTRFSNSPNSITDVDYSIEVGVQTFAECIQQAECKNSQDMDKLKLAWQGYNYGNGYIAWAKKRGGYTEENAVLFSKEQAEALGWDSYGDPQYVPHVMRYYSVTSLLGLLVQKQGMVSTAVAQLGNEGGQKFWSWYGFESRVEWCACFVSWCADQNGLIEKGQVPKFALCSDGVLWFQKQTKWKNAGTIPTAGMIIFFDWDNDTVADHVGIVEKYEKGIVYTIEGNSSDRVKQKNYQISSNVIMGYGVVCE